MNATNINLHPEPEQTDKDTQQLAVATEETPTIQPSSNKAVLDNELYLFTIGFIQPTDVFDEYLVIINSSRQGLLLFACMQ